MSETPRTIFANEGQDRFFWIPDDAELPPGDTVLRSLTGKKREVDLEAASAYEVPEDEAKAIVTGAVQGYARAAGRILSGAGSVLRQVAERQKDLEAKPGRTADAQELIADTLGITPHQLRNDPDAVVQGLKELTEGLKQTVRSALQDDPESQAAAKERVRVLADMVRDESGSDETAEQIEDLPRRIRELLTSPELEGQVREATKKLQASIDEMKQRLDEE